MKPNNIVKSFECKINKKNLKNLTNIYILKLYF